MSHTFIQYIWNTIHFYEHPWRMSLVKNFTCTLDFWISLGLGGVFLRLHGPDIQEFHHGITFSKLSKLLLIGNCISVCVSVFHSDFFVGAVDIRLSGSGKPNMRHINLTWFTGCQTSLVCTSPSQTLLFVDLSLWCRRGSADPCEVFPWLVTHQRENTVSRNLSGIWFGISGLRAVGLTSRADKPELRISRQLLVWMTD